MLRVAMNYDPQDPKNYAFYRMYIDDDDPPRRGSGCLTGPAVLFVLFCLVVLIAVFYRR